MTNKFIDLPACGGVSVVVHVDHIVYIMDNPGGTGGCWSTVRLTDGTFVNCEQTAAQVNERLNLLT